MKRGDELFHVPFENVERLQLPVFIQKLGCDVVLKTMCLERGKDGIIITQFPIECVIVLKGASFMEPGIRRLVKGLPELIPQASFYICQCVKILSVYLSDRLLQNFPVKNETLFQGVGIQSVHYHPKAPLLLGAFPKKRDVRFLKKVRIIFPLTALLGVKLTFLLLCSVPFVSSF